MIEEIQKRLLDLREIYGNGFDCDSDIKDFADSVRQLPIVPVKSGSLPFGLGTGADEHSREQVALLLDLFSVPYNPDLGFDWLFFRSVTVPAYWKQRFPSQALPIDVVAYSPGFRSPRSVALFPENFLKTPYSLELQPVYYFMDKFVERWFRITVPAVKKFLIDSQDFASLLQMNPEELLRVAATWVSMHEHFHEQGPLPIREALPIKSSRSAAALEELRVDLEVIRAGRESKDPFGEQVARFVFLERLLRYQLEGTAKGDYDARGSVALFRYLIGNGVIHTSDRLLFIDHDELWPALYNLLDQISSSERLASSCTDPAEARLVLSKFIDDYFQYDPVLGLRRYDLGPTLTLNSREFA